MESSAIYDEHYVTSGPAEKRIRNIHILIGLSVLILEYLLFPIEDWILSPGLLIPLFIIITGAFYSLTSSTESGRRVFNNVIKPRLGNVTKEQETAYYNFRKTGQILILVQAYLVAVLFTWLWVTLNALGQDPIWGLIWFVPAFVFFLLATGSIGGFVLKHTKYKILIPLLDVEVAWMKERRKLIMERRKLNKR
ncbi:MAG: hypothetical protein ACFFEK_02255 [Candidatus Thorarchaeota archaeon]